MRTYEATLYWVRTLVHQGLSSLFRLVAKLQKLRSRYFFHVDWTRSRCFTTELWSSLHKYLCKYPDLLDKFVLNRTTIPPSRVLSTLLGDSCPGLRKVQRLSPTMIWLEMLGVFCAWSRCSVSRLQVFLFYNDDHFGHCWEQMSVFAFFLGVIWKVSDCVSKRTGPFLGRSLSRWTDGRVGFWSLRICRKLKCELSAHLVPVGSVPKTSGLCPAFFCMWPHLMYKGPTHYFLPCRSTQCIINMCFIGCLYWF